MLEVTESHPFLVYTNTGFGAEFVGNHHIRFKRAKDITTDDKFVTADGTYVGIKNIEIIAADQMALDYEKSIKQAENKIEGLFKD